MQALPRPSDVGEHNKGVRVHPLGVGVINRGMVVFVLGPWVPSFSYSSLYVVTGTQNLNKIIVIPKNMSHITLN